MFTKRLATVHDGTRWNYFLKKHLDRRNNEKKLKKSPNEGNLRATHRHPTKIAVILTAKASALET